MKFLLVLPFLLFLNLEKPDSQTAQQTFTVIVEVDTYQPDGFGAVNVKTGESYFTDRRTKIFEELPKGTYRFSAYEGYFCGASTKTITIDETTTVNGQISIQLEGWCE